MAQMRPNVQTREVKKMDGGNCDTKAVLGKIIAS